MSTANQAATDSEPQESLASNVNVQKAKGEKHTFEFTIRNGKPNIVEYDTSKTVFGALNKHGKFRGYDKEEKVIIITRSKGNIPGAVVKTDFPCCLLEVDENLKINLYKSEIASTNEEETADTDPQNLVTFYIRTRGKNIKAIMKSSVFVDNNIDYVCVFAHKGDSLKEALQNDGRFIDAIFDNGSELVDDDKGYAMYLTVDNFNGKTFKLNVNSAGKKPKNSAKNKGKPNNTEQKTTQEIKKEVIDSSTEDHAAQNTAGNSEDLSGDSGNSFSTDVRKILETMCEYVLKKLEQQTNPQVQKLIQEEYDKGVECFTEVNKVKQIMKLSDSVCMIVADSSTKGTGFLLFDRFILTNAHVVKDIVQPSVEDPHRFKVLRTTEAVFNFEKFLGREAKILQIKEDLVAYGYVKDDKLRQLDFALLELENGKPDNCTELLSCYRKVPPPKSGGIYIVGHPACGVKKMDPCFIIGIETQLQSINEHISKNVSCPYVSWQCWPYLYKNQITYNSCFFHGSSGSPVFDEHCNLIGIHTGGFDYKEGEKTRSVIEYSYSMQPILESIITQVEKRSDIFTLLTTFEAINKIITETN